MGCEHFVLPKDANLLQQYTELLTDTGMATIHTKVTQVGALGALKVALWLVPTTGASWQPIALWLPSWFCCCLLRPH